MTAGDGWDRHRDPVLAGPGCVAVAGADRQHGRLARACGHDPGAVGQRPAGVGGVAQDAADTGHVGSVACPSGSVSPDRSGAWPADTAWPAVPGTRRTARRPAPPRLAPAAPRPAVWAARGPGGSRTGAERRPGPRQQGARAQPGLPPAAHSLGDQGALVLGDRAADLPTAAGRGGRRSSDGLGNSTRQPRPASSCSSSTWWTSLRASRSGSATSTTSRSARAAWSRSRSRPGRLEAGAAVAVVAVHVLLVHRPAALGRRRAQPVQLLPRWSGPGLDVGSRPARTPQRASDTSWVGGTRQPGSIAG